MLENYKHDLPQKNNIEFKPQYTEEDVNRVYNKLSSIMEYIQKLGTQDFIKKYNDIIKSFADELIKKYSREELINYRAYHILIGSTPNPEKKPEFFDLPGEDSIEKYLDEKIKELGLTQ